MKKNLIIGGTLLTLLLVGAFAYAHGPGYGWGGGHMMGPGYGGHMMGSMMGQGFEGGTYENDFMNETADLRKQLHEKRFDYFEATRHTDTDPGELTKLEKEIYELQTRIREKAPRTQPGAYGGYGRCW